MNSDSMGWAYCTECGYEWEPENEPPECPVCNGKIEIDKSCPDCGEFDVEENRALRATQRHKCTNDECETGYYNPAEIFVEKNS